MKSVVVELDDESYDRLQRRARRLGVDTETAARSAVCEHLAEEQASEASVSVRATLERMRQLRSRQPKQVDAAKLIREVRDEAEERDERRWG